MAMRGKKKKADYVLYHSADLPIAIVEATKHPKPVGAGLQQRKKGLMQRLLTSQVRVTADKE